MTVSERLISIHLMEKISVNTEYANRIGVSSKLKIKSSEEREKLKAEG